MPIFCYARLTDEQLKKVQAFEKETGKKALVLGHYNMKPEEISEEELEKLEALEQELGYVIVVVK